MAQQEIVIDIDANGNVQVEGFGFSGPECKQLTAGIEEALGTPAEVHEKPEMHERRAVLRQAPR